MLKTMPKTVPSNGAQLSRPLRELLPEALDQLQRIQDAALRGTGLVGLSTGLAALDGLLGGLQPGDLIVLAARPSVGKTSLAMQMALAAARQGTRALVYSLEMTAYPLVIRLLSSVTRIPHRHLREGLITMTEWGLIREVAPQLNQLPLWIDDRSGLDAETLVERIQAEQAQAPVGLVVVDYLQQLRGRSRTESRQQEVGEIARALKAAAKTLHVPVLALSQLSRGVERRTPPIPELYDLRESGEIEQEADVVIMMYRERVHDPYTSRRNETDLLIRKHRHGETGTVTVRFDGDYLAFEDATANAEARQA